MGVYALSQVIGFGKVEPVPVSHILPFVVRDSLQRGYSFPEGALAANLNGTPRVYPDAAVLLGCRVSAGTYPTTSTSKTALEIAGSEALFGQSGGADEPWALGLSGPSSSGGGAWGSAADTPTASSSWYPGSATTDFFAGDVAATASATRAAGGSYYSRSKAATGKSGARRSKGATNSDEVSTSAGLDVTGMGNYDREYHLRMQMPQTTATHRLGGPPQHSHLPHRMKNNGAGPTQQQQVGAGGSAAGPYFHHLLDPERRSLGGGSGNSSTNSLLYNPSTASYGDQPSTGKRPRLNSASNHAGSGGNSTSNSYLRVVDPLPPYAGGGGYQSPPAYDNDHPLPDFNASWFAGRMTGPQGGRVSSSSAPAVNTSVGSHSSNVATITGGNSNANNPGVSLAGIGSGLASPNGSSMFAVESLLPDYESGLYSLWNGANGANVMGYEGENDTGAHQPNPQTHPQQPSLYMSPEEELKMDYPQLSEFNQGDLDYLCEPMESGGPSPTTPLGTSTGNSLMKMDHLVTTDRRAGAGAGASTTGSTGNTREPQMERLLSTSSTSDYLVKRDRDSEDASSRAAKRGRGTFGDTFGAASTTGGGNATSGNGGSFRSLARNATIESKRGGMPSLGSYHGGTTSLLSPEPSTGQPVTADAMAPSTAATSGSGGTKTTAKRPRSRQCDFPGCLNRARSHQKCKKHGGAHQCVFEGCLKNSQSRGLCIAHGGGSRCKVEGCVRAAQSKGLCKSHGGGEFCAVEGCRKKAHLKHLCRTHGGGVRCKFAKCSKWAQRKGWCMAHAKEFVGT
ncbi:hypothetical protein BBJ28_00010774 [Nothophytophthora sp. Chile5]|nr:hypothetical protein BBJ28_00010774 [Nothophytophthora sp. Chile5]